MKAPRFLIVEDDRALSLALAATVRQAGVESDQVATAAQARKALREAASPYAALILDIGLPDENGLKFLESLSPEARPPTIVVTAHGDLDNAITARKLGIRDFFTKPLDFEAFKKTLRQLVDQERDTATLPQPGAAYIGASPAMRPVFQKIAHACGCDDSVLITGQTGTGRSLTASQIQRHSSRSGKPCVTLRTMGRDQTEQVCRALDEAGDGVLILDDLAGLNLDAQAELLRRWEQENERLPRILAVSGETLREDVQAGQFRPELFYRLQVLEVHLPPLRERMEDIPALFGYFLAQLQPGRSLNVDQSVLDQLERYPWPGNLRELRNVASFVVTSCAGGNRVTMADLPAHICAEIPEGDQQSPEEAGLENALDAWLGETGQLPPYRELARRLDHILARRLLRRFDGKLARMAEALEANRTTLRKRLKSSE